MKIKIYIRRPVGKQKFDIVVRVFSTNPLWSRAKSKSKRTLRDSIYFKLIPDTEMRLKRFNGQLSQIFLRRNFFVELFEKLCNLWIQDWVFNRNIFASGFVSTFAIGLGSRWSPNIVNWKSIVFNFLFCLSITNDTHFEDKDPFLCGLIEALDLFGVPTTHKPQLGMNQQGST
jgi:hypothetical protein